MLDLKNELFFNYKYSLLFYLDFLFVHQLLRYVGFSSRNILSISSIAEHILNYSLRSWCKLYLCYSLSIKSPHLRNFVYAINVFFKQERFLPSRTWFSGILLLPACVWLDNFIASYVSHPVEFENLLFWAKNPLCFAILIAPWILAFVGVSKCWYDAGGGEDLGSILVIYLNFLLKVRARESAKFF